MAVVNLVDKSAENVNYCDKFSYKLTEVIVFYFVYCHLSFWILFCLSQIESLREALKVARSENRRLVGVKIKVNLVRRSL